MQNLHWREMVAELFIIKTHVDFVLAVGRWLYTIQPTNQAGSFTPSTIGNNYHF